MFILSKTGDNFWYENNNNSNSSNGSGAAAAAVLIVKTFAKNNSYRISEIVLNKSP